MTTVLLKKIRYCSFTVLLNKIDTATFVFPPLIFTNPRSFFSLTLKSKDIKIDSVNPYQSKNDDSVYIRQTLANPHLSQFHQHKTFFCLFTSISVGVDGGGAAAISAPDYGAATGGGGVVATSVGEENKYYSKLYGRSTIRDDYTRYVSSCICWASCFWGNFKFSHLAWVQADRKTGGLGDLNYPLILDVTKSTSKSYNILIHNQLNPTLVEGIEGDLRQTSPGMK